MYNGHVFLLLEADHPDERDQLSSFVVLNAKTGVVEKTFTFESLPTDSSGYMVGDHPV